MQPSPNSTSSDADALRQRVAELKAERDSLRERLARVGEEASASGARHAAELRASRAEAAATHEEATEARQASADVSAGHARAMQASQAKLATSEAANTTLRDANAVLEVNQAALHASEARLQMVLESATDYAIVTADLNGLITGWNSGAEQILGWSRAEALGQNAELFFTPEDRAEDMAAEEMRTALEQGRAADERWHLRRDGTRFWANGTMMPLRGHGGEAVGYLKILSDRTRQHEAGQALRRSEAALAESEAQFRATFEQAAVGVAHVGLDGPWLRVNGRLCAMLGYSEAELLERTFQEITHPDDVEANLAHARQLAAGEVATYSMEKRYLRKNGSHLWAGLTAALMRDHTGTPRHFISVVEDITDRKRAEAANAHLAAIVAFSDDAIVSFAPECGRILTWNSGAERLFGYTEAEMTGAPATRLLPPDLPGDERTGLFDWAMAGRPVVAHETVRVANNGERIPVSITAARMLAPDDRIIPAALVTDSHVIPLRPPP